MAELLNEPIKKASSREDVGDPFRKPSQEELAEAEVRLGGVEFREPIIDNYSTVKAQGAKADVQWLAVTEAIRRAIIANPEARQTMVEFAGRPLSEVLPRQAVESIAEADDKTARLSALGGALLAVLKYDSVPDELLKPDIRTAPYLIRKGAEAENFAMTSRYYDSFDPEKEIENIKKRVDDRPGVTQAEKDLVVRRYRYARDVKLLSLMAELTDNPIDVSTAVDGLLTHELPSGTKLAVVDGALEEVSQLLDPRAWENRRQLKDRVYAVHVAGKEYVMKERKTTRHTDTPRHGHYDGLTSESEFKVARDFARLGAVREGDIEVRGEKPLGYVKFPDGYQFSLYEFEPDIDTYPKQELSQEIIASKSEYAEEFAQIQQRAKEIYAGQEYVMWGKERLIKKPWLLDFSRAARRQRKEYKNQPKPDELTFEEFAVLKANNLFAETHGLTSRAMSRLGYGDIDGQQRAYRIKKTGNRPTLEVIRYDYEYTYRDPGEERRLAAIKRQNNENGTSAHMRLSELREPGEVRIIQEAAAYALVEQTGWTIPAVLKREVK